MPSFLWAIGLSQFQQMFNISEFTHTSGALGSIFVFSSLLIPLTIYTSMLGVKSISSHQIDAFVLTGSAYWSFLQVLKRIAPITILISFLAGIVTLSDPGPGLIFGFPGAAAEILVSFSALFDFDLARQQCFFIAGLSLLFFLPIIFFLGSYLTTVVLAQESFAAKLVENPTVQRFATPVFIALLIIIIGIPLVGLFKPLWQGFDFIYALKALHRTWVNTLFYSITAGLLSMTVALIVVLSFGHYQQMRVILVSFSLLFIILPSSFVAINVLEFGTSVSARWDWLLRGRFLVAAVLGLRFFPIATLLIMNRYVTISPTWFDAAKISGVSKIKFYFKVLIPFLVPTLALSVLVVSLLAMAEIGTVLLLRPPGEDSFPIVIFTVMANASEAKVSSLCFIYFIISALNLTILWAVFGKKA
jgi:ABC-type Fe3+ transport system permease subunit